MLKVLLALRPRTRLGALAATLAGWAMIPLPGVFEALLAALWPRKKRGKLTDALVPRVRFHAFADSNCYRCGQWYTMHEHAKTWHRCTSCDRLSCDLCGPCPCLAQDEPKV